MSVIDLHSLVIALGYVMFISHILITRARFNRILTLVEVLAGAKDKLERNHNREVGDRLVEQIEGKH